MVSRSEIVALKPNTEVVCSGKLFALLFLQAQRKAHQRLWIAAEKPSGQRLLGTPCADPTA